MSRIVIFLFIALVAAVAVAFPNDSPPQLQGLQRIIKVGAPEVIRVKRYGGYGYGGHGYGHGGYGGYGHGHHGGHGGFHKGHGGCYGGCGGGHRGGYPFGGGSFANSGAKAGSISTPLGSASFSSSFANSGARGYGR